MKNKEKKGENILTSQSHPCFITFAEPTRWTIFPPKFINGTIISAGTQIFLFPWEKKNATVDRLMRLQSFFP